MFIKLPLHIQLIYTGTPKGLAANAPWVSHVTAICFMQTGSLSSLHPMGLLLHLDIKVIVARLTLTYNTYSLHPMGLLMHLDIKVIVARVTTHNKVIVARLTTHNIYSLHPMGLLMHLNIKLIVARLQHTSHFTRLLVATQATWGHRSLFLQIWHQKQHSPWHSVCFAWK